MRSRSAGELNTAAEVENRVSGHRKIATLIRKNMKSPEKRKSGDVNCGGKQLNSDEALAYYVDSVTYTSIEGHLYNIVIKGGTSNIFILS